MNRAGPGEPTCSHIDRPLHGRRIALTRPQGLNDEWAAALSGAGATPVTYPLLCLLPVPTPLPPAAASADGFVFISPSAVAFAWPVLQRVHLPQARQRLAAVGSGTAAALLAGGAGAVLHPPGHGDSTALLQCLPALDGQHWVIVRGEGGRELLSEALRERGAHVHDWAVYRREADAQQLHGLLQDLDTLDALLLSSSDVVRTLFAHAGESLLQRLQSKPLVVLHPRIAAAARALGARRVAVCDGAQDLPAALARVLDDRCP